ncbi:hypothetical protein [Lysobacter enzymogenes]|uniref:hypothetical protein n=1 Tax=Lysobacter enzymogenes TaxID=69 RepID=UPI001A9792D5|nr:hypothetical protein [Lysobacter enzymogenes]QQP96526.1 hypothetical protein JHW38_00260 [Lysobacter enzymogenes]
MTQTFERGSRPSFRERVYALAGHSTWREPAQGSSAQRPIPTDHLIAAALAFGRDGKDDIGPDIAFDMATGRMGHHQRVCAALGAALAGARSRVVARNRPYIAVAAWAGYCAVLGQGVPPRPDGCNEQDWGDLVAAAALSLERMAEDALARAGRNARRAA